MKKSVLFICARYPSIGGGIEKVTTYLSSALAELGYDIGIIGVTREESNTGEYILPDVRVEVLHTPSGINTVACKSNIDFLLTKVSHPLFYGAFAMSTLRYPP